MRAILADWITITLQRIRDLQSFIFPDDRVPDGLDGRRTAASLATYRVGAVLLALRDLLELWRHQDLFFGAQSVPPVLLPVWALVLSALAIGAYTRVTAAAHFALTVVFLGSPTFDPASYSATQDVVLTMNALFMLVLPVGRTLSVDALRRAYHQASNGVVQCEAPAAYARFSFLFGLLLGLFYLDSALWKVFSPMWRAGLGIWTGATLPHLMLGPIPFIDNRLVMMASSYGIVLFELMFLPLFLLVPQSRRALTLAGIVFHLGMLPFYPFRGFALGMATLYIPLLGAFRWRSIPVTSEPIAYSTTNPADRLWINVLGLCDVSGSLRFIELPTNSLDPDPLRWPTIRQGLQLASLGLWPRLVLWGPIRRGIEHRLSAGLATVGRAPGEPNPMVERRAYVSIAVLWTVVSSLVMLRSLPVIGDSTPVRVVSMISRVSIYPYTGIRERIVFNDGLFATHGHQFTLSGDGAGWTSPIYDTEGNYFSPERVDRSWELWWKHTHAGYLSVEQTERNLGRWADHFSIPPGVIRVRARAQQVSTEHWSAGVLTKNREARWFDIGRLELDDHGEWRVAWASATEYGPDASTHEVVAAELRTAAEDPATSSR